MDNNWERTTPQEVRESEVPVEKSIEIGNTIEPKKDNIDTSYVDNYYTPKDRLSIENTLIKYQTKLTKSPLTLNEVVEFKALNVEAQNAFVHKNLETNFNVSPAEFASITKMMASTTDLKALNKRLTPALLFSHSLGISVEKAMYNLESIGNEFAKGRWIKGGDNAQVIFNAFEIGLKSNDRSDRANEKIKIIDAMDKITSGRDDTLIEFGGKVLDELNPFTDTQEKTLEGLQKELDDKNKEIEELDKFLITHRANEDQNFSQFEIRASEVAQALPYIASITEGALKGAATMAVAISVGAGLGIFTGGTGLVAGAAVGTSLIEGAAYRTGVKSAITLAAGMAGTFRMKDISKGSKYLDLVEQGVPHAMARDSADIFGSLIAGEELALGGVSLASISTMFGVQTGSIFLTKFMSKMALSGKFTAALGLLATGIATGSNAFITEAVQEGTEIVFDKTVLSYNELGKLDLDNIIDTFKIEDLHRVIEAGTVGAFVGLVLGVPHIAGQARMNIKQYSALQNIYKNTSSKKDAINKANKVAPSVSDEVISAQFDDYKKRDTKLNPLSGETKGSEIGGDLKLKTKAPVSPTTINFSNDVTTKIGSKLKNFINTAQINDNKGNIIGRVFKKLEGNKLTITNIELDKSNILTTENVIKQIIMENPGKDIQLDINDDLLLEKIRDRIVEDNPRGEEFGLNWLVLDQSEQEIVNKIKKPYNMTDEEAIVSAALIGIRAKNEGFNNALDYWDKHYGKINTTALNEGDYSSVKGSIVFEPDTNRVKAVLYTAKNSDVSTFSHETFHLAINQMENKGELASAIQEWAKSDDFETYVNEHKSFFKKSIEEILETAKGFNGEKRDWSVNEDELSASLFEAWNERGITNNPKLEELMRKISEYFKAIYGAVKGTVKMNDEVANFYDSMYAEQNLEAEVDTNIEAEVDINIEAEAQESGSLTQEQIDAGKKFNPDAKDVLYQTVYHGTAYTFDKFKTSYVGRGEGNQIYGYGFYFTQLKGIANRYAKQTSKIAKEYNEEYNKKDNKKVIYKVTIPDAGYLQSGGFLIEKEVQQFIDLAKKENPKLKLDINNFSEHYENGKIMVDIFNDAMQYYMSSKNISKILREMGYVGLQYPVESFPENSKSTKSDFVIFNENDIKIDSRLDVENDVLFQSISKENDEKYLKSIEIGDMQTVNEMVNEKKIKAIEDGMQILPDDSESVAYKYHKGYPPITTKKVYAILTVGNGLRTAFAGKGDVLPIGIWLDAQAIDGIESTTKKFPDGTPKKYIPGTTGLNPKQAGIDPTQYGLPKSQKFLFFRPGKHAADIPNFSQMNVKSEITSENKSAMPHDKIIFEIEVGADIDLTDTMLSEAPKHKTTGKAMMREAGLQRIPREGGKEGFYKYKTNPNAKGNWIIASSFKINRLVSYDEIVSKNKELGLEPPVWNGGYAPSEFGITDNLLSEENAKIKKISDPIVYDNNGDVIPLSERFTNNGDVLFQSSTIETQREKDTKAINMALEANDLQSFEEAYKEQFGDTAFPGFYERIYDEAITKAGLQEVEHRYKTSNITGKNTLFKKSIENNQLANQFIKKVREFKKAFNKIKGDELESDRYEVKKVLMEEINSVMDEANILGTETVNDIDRKALRAIAEEFDVDARLIFAKLNGLDYMMAYTEYDSNDYTSVWVQEYNPKNQTLASAVLTSSRQEERIKMQKDYAIYLENIGKEKVNLKAALNRISTDRDRYVASNKKNKEALAKAKIDAIERENKILLEAEKAKNKVSEGHNVEKYTREIKNTPVNTNVRNDYARMIYAIQSLVDPTVRNNFKTQEGYSWDAKIAHDLVRRYLGSMYSNIFTEDMINDVLDNKTKSTFVSTDLEILQALISNIKTEGIQKRNADKLIIDTKVANNQRDFTTTIEASYKEFQETKGYKIVSKIPYGSKAVSTTFSGVYNMARKIELMEGRLTGKEHGNMWNKMISERRERYAQETTMIAKRMGSIYNIFEKYGLKELDSTKTEFTTEYDGFVQKHTMRDLAYYWMSKNNLDNIAAVAGGHLMTYEERIDTVNISREEFVAKAEERYKFVLNEAETVYKENEAYHEIFDAIYAEFNGDTMKNIVNLMMKVKNEMVQKILKYIPIFRVGQETLELFEEFDKDESYRENKIGTTKFQALLSRKQIDIRAQSDINTDAIDLVTKTIEKQEHLLANYEYVYELKNTFTGKKAAKLKTTIINTYGEDMYNNLITYIEEIANPYANKNEKDIDRILKPLKGNIYPAYLGGRLPTVIMQLVTSPWAFLGKMSVSEYLGSFAYMSVNRKGLISDVNNLSAFMKDRSWDFAWKDSAKTKHKGGQLSRYALQKEHYTEMLMSPLQWADTTMVYPGWMKLYQNELSRLGMTSEENIQKAVLYADDYVRKTQPLSEVTEVAPIFKGEESVKLFTQFTASLSPIFQNMTFDTVANVKLGNHREAIGVLIGYGIAGALLFAVRGGYNRDDDAEEVFRKFIASLISQPMASVPLVGMATEYLSRYAITGDSSGYYSVSKFPAFDKGVRGITKLISGDLEKGFSLTIDALLTAYGAPVSLKTDIGKAIEEESLLPIIGYKIK